MGENFDVTGTVKLFTERVPCSSCSNVIELFSSRYPNLTIEIIHNNGTLLTNF
ncbi:deaminase domain-containing protein [Ornithobacterium rhinotracheale]